MTVSTHRRSLGQTEVHQLRPGLGQHNVRRLQIAVDHSRPVCLFQTLTDFNSTFQHLFQRQVEGREADARSDIFALGAVLYEMSTGRRVFTGKTQASIVAAILTARRSRANVVYDTPGYLLFIRDATLMAQPFDPKDLNVHGDAVPVADGVLPTAARLFLSPTTACLLMVV